ncbi:hypothetical protein [Blastococcus sp. SYSU D00820]
MPSPRRAVLVASAAAVALLTAGCGWPVADDDAAGTPPPAAAPSPSTAPPAAPAVVLRAALSDAAEYPGYTGEVTVTVLSVEQGLPPLGPSFGGDCAVPADARYVPVEVVLRTTGSGAQAGLAATVAATAADGSEVGVHVGSSAPGVRYCQDGTTRPAADRFSVLAPAGGGEGRATAFVILPPAAPGSAVPVLDLSLTALVNHAPPDADGPWTVTRVDVGSACDRGVCATTG